MKLICFVLALCVSTVAFAQENELDLQFRVPTHIQVKEEGGLGLASWAVFPDITTERNGKAMLLVSGILWQVDQKFVAEMMAGGKVNQDGYVDPLINIRLFDAHMSKLGVSVEIQQTFRNDRLRFLWWVATDTPVALGKFKMKVGAETENIHFLGKKDTWGIGPRVIVPLPLHLPKFLRPVVMVTYQIHSDRNYVRVYTLTNVLFRK